jgi:glycerate 2-kinase
MLQFSSHSLELCPRRDSVRRILSAAMQAADPRLGLPRFLRRKKNLLNVDGRVYNLDNFSRIFLLAVGKAAETMTEALLPFVEDRLSSGLIVTKRASRPILGRLTIMEAGHPLPDVHSLEAGRRVCELVSCLTPRDLLICLLSGGASALMAAPLEGIALEDLRSITSILLAAGASIDELNVVRKRLDYLKGGGLARRAASAHILSLILSDVVGDRLDLIASGPTVPDSSTREDVEQVITRYSLASRLPSNVFVALAREPDAGTFDHVQNVIVGSNAQAARSAIEQARNEGFRARVLTTSLQGEAREAGAHMARILCRARTRPLCLIAGGETTVTVTGEGQGGRNQELALAAALELDGLRDVYLISLATDGDDGMTGAAGAVVTGETLSRARSLGLDALDFLRRNDSHTFFARLGDLLVPGPTGTNVNDLVLLLAH